MITMGIGKVKYNYFLDTKSEKVCLIEKAVLCAAESSRHSGIVRSANADPDASMMASISTKMWKNLNKF